MNAWIHEHPVMAIGLAVWAAGVLWLMPGRTPGVRRPRLPGLLATAAGIVMFCGSSGTPHSELANEIMFWVFGVSALLCAVLMITSHNPVYGALWFALATLSTCGLFLLQNAPFLAAATVIVYAGAVIVTFLFVIMLAQQAGRAGYDQRSTQPVLATISAFILLGAISVTMQMQPPVIPAAVASAEKSDSDNQVNSLLPGNVLSRADAQHPVGELQGVGRSLFGDYLFAVEIAGTLLLIASIGAISIAPRREQGEL